MKTLIVEDDLMTQCVLAQVLTELGHEVVSYENAEQAVLAYQKDFYPLLFVDAALPGMGGLQFCKWVRSQPNGDKVFIMVAPSRGQPADMNEILEVGANDFLPKPFGPNALKVRLTIAARQMQDFFERKGLEDTVRQSQEGFHRIVKTASEGVWLLDVEFRTEYANLQIAAMLGCQVDEMAQRSVTDFFEESEREGGMPLIDELRQGKEIRREIVFRRKDGSECPALVSSAPILTAAGEFKGSLWMVTDLTKHRHLENEISQTRGKFEAEIRNLTGQFESTGEALQQVRGELETRLREHNSERTRARDELKAETAGRKKAEQALAEARKDADRKARQQAEAMAQVNASLAAGVLERARLTESLQESQSRAEALQQQHRDELENAGRTHLEALGERQRALEKLQEDSAARVRELSARAAEAGEQLKHETAARVQSEQELLNVREELASRVKQHTGELLALNETLKAEMAERKCGDEELLQARAEFNQRAKDHTAELIEAGENLRTMLAERTRGEELFAKTRDELESRLNERGRELAEARRESEAKSAERLREEQLHQKTLEELKSQLTESARKLDQSGEVVKQQTSELARLNEQLNTAAATRKNAEEEVEKTRAALESAAAAAAALTQAGDELKARMAVLDNANAKLKADLEAAGQLGGRELVYARLGKLLGECSAPNEAARVVANASQELFGWDACTIDLFSMDENRVHPVLNIDTVNGRPAEVPAAYLDLGPTPIMKRVIQEGPQLVLRRGAAGSHTDQILFGDRATLSASFMCVPIKVAGKVVGFFSIQSYAPEAYDPQKLAGLEALADHYAGALERVRAEEMQRRSEDRFRLVARATTDIVWDWNVPLNQVWRNDVFQTVFGYRPEEIEMGIESLENRLHPDDRERVMASLRKSLDHDDQFWSAEYRFRRADGSFAHVNDRGYVIRDKNRQAIRMVGAMLDISHHKQVEEAMIEGQARKGAILESALDGILTLDHEGTLFEWNPAAERMFGHRRADVLGKELSQLIIPLALRDRYQREMGQHLAAGGGDVIGNRVEMTAVRANGSEFPVELAISRIPTDGPPIFTGFIRDITERKRAEMEIQKLAAFPRRNPNPVFEFAADGSLTYFNDAAQEMALSLGKDHPLAILPDRAMEVVKDCLAKGQNKLRLETVMNGRTISWSFFPIPANQVVHCYSADITERTSLEAQLRQAQKMESVGQLAAGVAHDFNNILSVIQGYSAILMEEKDLKPDTGEALKQINSATQRATHLTRQLLTFSRKQAMHVQTLDLNEVINSVSKLLRRVLGESVTVQFDFLANLPPVEADTGMMEQIVMNLAINARDAMPRSGQLTIATSVADIDESYADHNPEARPGRFVCLSVADAGCGMDEGTLGRIFEPFFTTKPAGRGTGLGLATVYGIVKQHRGWIEVQSQVGKGTTFKIYLPASDRLLAPAPETGARQLVRGGSETLLLVEDEPAVLAMARGILERLGYTVLEAPSGDEAAAVWSRQGPQIHLLLTDMVMPGELNGRQLAEKLLAERPELKVMYTSGYSVDLLGTGMVNNRNFVFLQKPYHPDTLALMVRNCLDAS